MCTAASIYLAIPDCDTLKTLPNVKADVVFENYDCTVKGKPARSFFASLAGEMKKLENAPRADVRRRRILGMHCKMSAAGPTASQCQWRDI